MKIRNELQGSKEWFDSRLGKITGTMLADIMGTPYKKGETFFEILGERMTPEVDMEHLHENSLSRGMRLENEAVLAFEYVTGKKVMRCGIVESADDEMICYSPDGIIDYDVHGYTEDIECKCPEGKNYMKIVTSNEIPKEYYWQIIQGFVVNPKLKKRWFVAYNPDIPSYPIHIIEVKRRGLGKDIKKALKEQKLFLKSIESKLKEIR